MAGFDVENIFQILLQEDGKLPLSLPAEIAENCQAAKNAFPNARYQLLSHDDIRAFLLKHFDSDVISAFDMLRPYAYKADLARLCLLYIHGGAYVDLGVRIKTIPPIPSHYKVALFRDNYSLMPWGIQNGLLFAAAGLRELRLAITLIVGLVASQSYGAGPLSPTGPDALGRAFAILNDDTSYWVGNFLRYKAEGDKIAVGYFAPDGSLVAVRSKVVPGDLKHLGLEKTNNYLELYQQGVVYGEIEVLLPEPTEREKREPEDISLKALTRLPWRVELEIAKFLCTIGLRRDGSFVWERAMARKTKLKIDANRRPAARQEL